MLFTTAHRFVAFATAFTTILLVQTTCAAPLANETTLETRFSGGEFLGYTGVESSRAQAYMDGTFFKRATSLVGTTLGNGIYLADEAESVVDYAQEAAERKKSQPWICYFYAVDEKHWQSLKKSWIPKKDASGTTLWGEGRERARMKYANMATSSFIRVGILPRGGNQLVIPTDMTSGIVVRCDLLSEARQQVKGFSYVSMIKAWNIEGYTS